MQKRFLDKPKIKFVAYIMRGVTKRTHPNISFGIFVIHAKFRTHTLKMTINFHEKKTLKLKINPKKTSFNNRSMYIKNVHTYIYLHSKNVAKSETKIPFPPI